MGGASRRPRWWSECTRLPRHVERHAGADRSPEEGSYAAPEDHGDDRLSLGRGGHAALEGVVFECRNHEPDGEPCLADTRGGSEGIGELPVLYDAEQLAYERPADR